MRYGATDALRINELRVKTYLSRQRSRVRAPRSNIHILKDLHGVLTLEPFEKVPQGLLREHEGGSYGDGFHNLKRTNSSTFLQTTT
jgi:hypothetical protein